MQPKDFEIDLIDLSELVCDCEKCKARCKRPCWPTPNEAQALIEAGFGNRLMNDYWGGDGPDGNDIHLLCPAEIGRAGGLASFILHSGCVMQNGYGQCILHDLGLKPLEGRVGSHNGSPKNLHAYVASLWNNPEAQQIVDGWWDERRIVTQDDAKQLPMTDSHLEGGIKTIRSIP